MSPDGRTDVDTVPQSVPKLQHGNRDLLPGTTELNKTRLLSFINHVRHDRGQEPVAVLPHTVEGVLKAIEPAVVQPGGLVSDATRLYKPPRWVRQYLAHHVQQTR